MLRPEGIMGLERLSHLSPERRCSHSMVNYAENMGFDFLQFAVLFQQDKLIRDDLWFADLFHFNFFTTEQHNSFVRCMILCDNKWDNMPFIAT